MTVYPITCSHVLKVPFETGGTGIVYIWIGSQATQEEAIHAEQMGRSMFDVSLRLLHWQVSMGCDQGQNWVFQNRVHTLDLWTHFL